jgi:hypothetical protein
MKTKNLILSSASLALALFVGAGILNANANNNQGEGLFQGWRPFKENKEEHQVIDQAIEDNNYTAFKELTQDRKIGEVITEENFAKFSEAHKLKEEGKFEESKKIMEELGLPMRNRGKMGNSEDRQALKEAISNNDYEAWKKLTEGRPIQEKINQDNFSQFVKAHELMENGNFEEARKVMEELGWSGFGMHGPKGMMR